MGFTPLKYVYTYSIGLVKHYSISFGKHMKNFPCVNRH